jgi:hypothetical protein
VQAAQPLEAAGRSEVDDLDAVGPERRDEQTLVRRVDGEMVDVRQFQGRTWATRRRLWVDVSRALG